MEKEYDPYWKRLDNVGIYYASSTTLYNPNIYRLSVKLKENVEENILRDALVDTLIGIPSFKVKLRRGFFWYYLENNSEVPVVTEDSHFPFTVINNLDNNYFLFKVTYYEKRINIDFSHILTDGTGSLHFLETLVTNYMKIKHPKTVNKNIVVEAELISKNEQSVDSFLRYCDEEIEVKKIKEKEENAYVINGTKSNCKNANVIIGTVSVKDVKELAKKSNVTINTYLTALLFYSIYQEDYKYTDSSSPILICIPVNLRNYFSSQSMSNFFSTAMIRVDFKSKEYSFEEVLCIVSEEIKLKLDKSVLLDKFRFFVKLQQNIISRFIPLIIKNLLLKSISSIISKRGATTVISNLGVVKVTEEVSKYIDKFDFITYNDYSSPIKLGICSFSDKLSISFSSVINDTDIQRFFFSHLASDGIEVKISTSYEDRRD